MLTYTICDFREDGRYAVVLSLPCFAGDGADFACAARMNRFYESAAGAMYRYAAVLKTEDVRRMTYLCCPDIETGEDGIITVTLRLSLRRIPFTGSCPTQRRELVHRWKDGVLLRQKRRPRKRIIIKNNLHDTVIIL